MTGQPSIDSSAASIPRHRAASAAPPSGWIASSRYDAGAGWPTAAIARIAHGALDADGSGDGSSNGRGCFREPNTRKLGSATYGTSRMKKTHAIAAVGWRRWLNACDATT